MSPIKAILTAPARFLRGIWRFFDPPLKVGRIPFTRTVLVIQAIAALTFVGYTLIKKEVHLPFSQDPYVVQVLMPDAQGLSPSKEPAVGVAGVNVGKVTGTEVQNGQALVTLRLDPDMKGKIFRNATAVVRPTSVLQTLIVNILPGDPKSGPLPDNRPIPASHTEGFVGVDQLTGILDSDTQAQVQVLVREASTALHGREPEIRQILAKLGRLTDGTTPLAQALADRRVLVSRLTEHLDQLFTTVGERGQQLADAVDAGSRTLEVTSNRQSELAAATRSLAPTLLSARRALVATRQLSAPLNPALDDLLRVAPQLTPASEQLRKLAPRLDGLVGIASRLVSQGKRPVRLLAEGLKGQAARVRKDQIPALRELVHLANLLNKYRFGLLEFANNWSGLTSVNRKAGPYAQFDVLNTELADNGFGLKTKAAKKTYPNGDTKLGRMLAEALELTCQKSNSAACLLRFNTPGLPKDPILPKLEAKGGGG